MSEDLSDSSSYSESTEDSNSDDHTPANIYDIISWNSTERKLTQLKETFQQFSADNRLFVIKSRCLSNNCGCNFKNYDILLAKVFVNFKLLVGRWCKFKFSKSTIPETEKLGTFIFFKDYQGFYEVMNENLEVIPFWNNVNQIIQNTPKSFIIRKDVKCLYIKETVDDPNVPHFFENTILKAGTILSYGHSKKYSVKKGRKIKDQLLVKCKDGKGNYYYLTSDEVVYASPLAGSENISGAHTFQSIIEKFRFPLNIKPLFLIPPTPNLPCTDRHFLQLTERHQLDLIFVTPISENKRLFIITPALFDDHVFTVGEFLPNFISKHQMPPPVTNQIECHQSKINDFFVRCHKYDTLSYLLKYAENISKVPQKFEISTISEFDEVYIEVEDIYFFIRNGFYPRNSIKVKPKKVDNDISNSNDNDNKSEEKTAVSSVKSSESEPEDEEESSDSSSTSISTESDFTSSTALEMSKQQFKKQAKSMPLVNKKNQIKSNDFNTSQCHIDLSVDDMLQLSSTDTTHNTFATVDEEVDQPSPTNNDNNDQSKKNPEIPEFYQHRLLESQKFKISDVENFNLKNTAV